MCIISTYNGCIVILSYLILQVQLKEAGGSSARQSWMVTYAPLEDVNTSNVHSLSASRQTSRLDVTYILPRHCRCTQSLATELLWSDAARIWNSLSQYVTSPPSLPVFHHRLKTHLFEHSWTASLLCLRSDCHLRHVNHFCYLLIYLLTH